MKGKGVYVLLINVEEDISVKVGSLGRLKFESGEYLYVGSAQNGFENRINHHLEESEKPHWHIDYLLNHENAEVISIFTHETGEKSDECRVASELKKFTEPVSDFGASDCGCDSHLFHVKSGRNLRSIN